jgi:hypothetical protein
MAMVGELLTDGTGPAYRGDDEAFAQRLLETQIALAG